MRNRLFRAVYAHLRIGGQPLSQQIVPRLHDSLSLGQLFQCELQGCLHRCRQRQRRCAASINGRARAAVNERLQNHAFALNQNAAAVETIKLVRCNAHGIYSVKADRHFPHRLCRIDMQPAIRSLPDNLRNFCKRLYRSQFAVHGAHGNHDGILPHQLAQMLQIHPALAVDVHQIYLISAFL